MAKYVSALTGPEMDAALQDMAQHNSEAWAVGERNGEAVSSADVTYHNNARYYSNNAMSAAARAEAAVPAGTAGALFFDQAQTLTDANKQQVYSNLSLNPAPAPNMVDNSWFLINQRGSASYSTTGQFVFDRWYLYSGAVSWSADGISTASSCLLYQNFDRVRFKDGAYYRVSVMLADGTIYSSRMAVDAVYHYIGGNTVPLRMRFEHNGKQIRFQIQAGAAGWVIRAVKIEATYYSTLSLDVMPDEAEELLKAYRYLYVIGTRGTNTQIAPAYLRSGTSWRAVIPLPVKMLAVPTVSIGTVSNLVLYDGSTTHACANVSLSNGDSFGTVALNITNTSITGREVAGLNIVNSDKLVISAEI